MLLLATTLRADEVPNTATVTVAEAEVRSGPGATAQMYVTNRLHTGDRVEIIKEMDGGWLAIKPPAGSFSWVNSRYLKQNVPTLPIWRVTDDKVPVLLGSTIKDGKPTVEGTKVNKGTQLRAVGAMKMADDGYWLPVQPPPGELRYIRAESVSRKSKDSAAPGAPPAAPPGIPNPPDSFPPAVVPGAPSATPPGAEGNKGGNDLATRAQQAERTGQYTEAIQLYRQLGAETANSNHALSVEAYNRAQWLADRLQVNPPPQQGNDPRTPATTTGRQAPAATPPAGWSNSGPGWLRRAGRCIDYSTMYVLENSQGIPILYATAQTGYSLETYMNRNVELIGVRQYRSDLRAFHMTVMQVHPLP
jgi:SH3-like domain-containing protein